MGEVLIAGSTGGREHALGDAMASVGENDVTFSHGNGGSREVGRNLGFTTHDQVVTYAVEKEVDLVVVGPEAPLVAGLADRLRAKGITVFGPGADGAQLEASKIFCAEFAEKNGIPQPGFFSPDGQSEARAYSEGHSPENIVIKADGLADGKAVILPETEEQATKVALGMLTGKLFGEAGKRILFQDRIEGVERSAFLIADGTNFVLLPGVQDYKRLKDKDQGPNTGGMGSCSAPFSDLEPRVEQGIMDIGERTMSGLRRLGIDFRGVLFLGLMLDANDGGKPKLLEYNVRFGDPETQVLATLFKYNEVGLYGLLRAAASGKLNVDKANRKIGKLAGSAVTVCMASEGYPESPKTGDTIYGLRSGANRNNKLSVYHGGTVYDEESGLTFTSGGRVLYPTAFGETVSAASKRVYANIGEDGLYFRGNQKRGDIGH